MKQKYKFSRIKILVVQFLLVKDKIQKRLKKTNKNDLMRKKISKKLTSYTIIFAAVPVFSA